MVGIGLDLQQTEKGLILTRSKSGKFVDIAAIAIGATSFPILIRTIAIAWYFHKEGISISPIAIFLIILLMAVGVVLFLLFLKGVDRQLMFARFALLKGSANYHIKQLKRFSLHEQEYPLETEVSVEESGKKIVFSITQNGQADNLFEFNSLNIDQTNYLKEIAEKLNE